MLNLNNNFLKNIIFFKIIGSILGFILSFLIVSKLDPNDYGNYSVFITFAYFFGLLCLFGVDIPLTNSLTEDKKFYENYKRIFGFIFYASLIIFLLIIFINQIKSSLTFDLIIIFLLSFSIWFFNLQNFILHSLNKVNWVIFQSFVTKNLLILTMILIFNNYEVTNLLLFNQLTFLVLIFLNIKYLQTNKINKIVDLNILKIYKDFNCIKRYFFDHFNLIYFNIFFVFERLLPLYLLNFINKSEVGLYSFALLFYYIFSLPHLSINSYLKNYLSINLRKKNYLGISFTLKKIFKFLLLSIFFFISLEIFLLDSILKNYLNSYSNAFVPILIMSSLHLTNSFFGPVDLICLLSGKHRFLIIFASLSFIITSLFFIIFYDSYNSFIASLSLFSSNLFWRFCTYLKIRGSLNIKVFI